MAEGDEKDEKKGDKHDVHEDRATGKTPGDINPSDWHPENNPL
ncbi:hypothetical protein [Goodfellowiella coeruleoviolacea]|uniref:Uncharacterized protein n=1 Tax=Goodfellowiella coeruleoviolacea TaxID=334858 RepID=A0AAE3GPC1_9PSEU|nr:hypothetical protein [Goodfellowiella coeruleoviolacea]MCP2169708.1 hypothetical protein [Goodfellowiella coeruleoviolacea]